MCENALVAAILDFWSDNNLLLSNYEAWHFENVVALYHKSSYDKKNSKRNL